VIQLETNIEITYTATTSTVGNSDFVLVMPDPNLRPKPRLVIEVICPWSSITDTITLEEFQYILEDKNGNESEQLSDREKSIYHSLHQVAGYMEVRTLLDTLHTPSTGINIKKLLSTKTERS